LNPAADSALSSGGGGALAQPTASADNTNQIKSNPHSTQAVRGLAPLVNQPAFYQAFGLKPGDNMYLPPEQRVTIV